MKNIQDIYPLSPLQQGVLFHSLYAPNAGMHFMQMGCWLRGTLKMPLFEQAWQQVVERHSALRTAFAWEELDDPVQIVYRRITVPISYHDWSTLSESLQERRLKMFLQEDRSRGFDLSCAPLTRLAIICTAEDVYHFIWSCHHLLVDGWAMNLVLREVLAIYMALESNVPIALPPARPYSDYITWLQKQDLSSAEAFWRQTLKGFIAPTQLQVGTVRKSEGGTFDDHGLAQAHLPATVTQQLQTLAREQRLTLNTILQGSWGLLLSRYSSEEDVVFGTTVSTRPAEMPEVESMVGIFVNTLPVRVQINPNDLVLTWLKVLQEQQAEARQYDYSPLVQVQGWSEIPRGIPLFESIMAFENFPVDNLLQRQPEKLQIDFGDLFDYTNYPLDLEIVPGPELSFRLHYDQRRYTDEEAANLLGHFGEILTNIATEPDQLLRTVSMVTPAEKDKLLHAMNGGQAAYPEDLDVIHDLFDRSVVQHPQKTAVVFQENRLSFADLNVAANQLAYRLIDLGIAPGQFVGLLLERSHHAVIGVLATFKAGGAYVPFDPKYPRERLHIMMEDAAPHVLVIQSWLRELIPSSFTGEVIEIDSIDLPGYPRENPGRRCSSQDIAYLMYTSGSTGKPKGVLIQHDTYIKTCLNYVSGYQLDMFEPISMNLGSISFGVFNGDMARSIFIGATLVICPDDVRLELDCLYDLIKREHVNIFESTPVLINAFLNKVIEQNKDLSWFRVLISSADAWRTVDYRMLRDKLAPHIRLINEYGMTEATHDSAFYEETETRHPDLPYVSIGKPFPNIRLYILDQHQQLIPRGFIGDLYIAGPCLARGYLHQDDLTHQRFLPDPFAPGGRMYKTGDLARWLPDGNVEFLGRADHQVKLRGFRIELGEIESVLQQHPAVKDVVVLARENSTGDKQLVAYAVSREKQNPTSAELHELVKKNLPAYMIPAAFVFLDALPLSSNGKINRLALPLPEESTWIESAPVIRPRTPMEQIIAEVWGNVLHRETVSITDGFFVLGGHSLLAIRAISQLRERLHIEIPIRLLFEQPSVIGMATAIEAIRATEQQLPVPPITPISREGLLPLTFVQRQLWIVHQIEPESPAYNMAAALRARGPLDEEALKRSLRALVQRHEGLRTTFEAVGGQPSQRIHPLPDHIALLRLDMRAFPREQRLPHAHRWLTEDAVRPFDLEHGPLWRISLLRLDEQEWVLGLVIHHILCDEWSMQLLQRDLFALYQQEAQGLPANLPHLAVQGVDLARWQEQWMQSEAYTQQLAYWQRQLHALPSADVLPPDYPRGRFQTYQSAWLREWLPAPVAQQLQTWGQREGATLSMTVLTGLLIWLYGQHEQEDLVVGTDMVTRTHRESEGVVGFFINQLVLRCSFANHPSVSEALQRVRQVTIEAYNHQGVPFEAVVEAVCPKREMNRTPLFQLKLISLPANQAMPALPGLDVLPFDFEKNTASFDLVIYLQEEGDGRLRLEWNYNTALFARTTITRMAQSLLALLPQLADQPEMLINKLRMPLSREKIVAKREEQPVEQTSTSGERSNPFRFKKVTPKPVQLNAQALGPVHKSESADNQEYEKKRTDG